MHAFIYLLAFILYKAEMDFFKEKYLKTSGGTWSEKLIKYGLINRY